MLFENKHTTKKIKLSVKLLLVSLVIAVIIYLYNYVKIRNFEINKDRKQNEETKIKLNSRTEMYSWSVEPKLNKKLKYILQWTPSRSMPFVYMGKGQQGFVEYKCPQTNCFVTSDRNYFSGDITKFDVIAFNGPEVVKMSQFNLPQKRSPHQKYVFATIESADNYPACTDRWNGFFNWTWTYKIDSDSRWGYVVVRYIDNKIIGPKKKIHWIKLEDMEPVPDKLKKLLEKKTKAAAWFVSNCVTRSKREVFVKQLQKELTKYNLTVDIYGRCGPFKCARNNEKFCDDMIRNDYHFYLSFENSFSEDYVTEKLIHALKFDAIPIVYGGADYTRFMPDGIYLNARELGVEKLAAKMNELIQDIEKYAEYFRWKKHYIFHRSFRHKSLETNDYCGFCVLLNDDKKLKQQTIYMNFQEWWNPPGRC